MRAAVPSGRTAASVAVRQWPSVAGGGAPPVTVSELDAVTSEAPAGADHTATRASPATTVASTRRRAESDITRTHCTRWRRICLGKAALARLRNVTNRMMILAACGLVLATAMGTVAACTASTSTKSAASSATPASAHALRSLNPNPPRPDQRAAFLNALDRDHVPHSTIGDAEILIGVGACGQIKAGRTVPSIAGGLSTAIHWTLDQATSVVSDAQTYLC